MSQALDVRRLEVCRHMDGRVTVRIGSDVFTLTSQEAIDFGVGLLRAAGCGIDFNRERPEYIRRVM